MATSKVDKIKQALEKGTILPSKAKQQAENIIKNVNYGTAGECSSYVQFLSLCKEAEQAQELVKSL